MTTCAPPMIGVTRFSVVRPKNSGLKLVNSSADDAYLTSLFDPERLAGRFDIFGCLTAPILQTLADNHPYTHLVQYSPQLPQPWKTRLFALCEKYPVLKPVVADGRDIVDAVRDEVATWPKGFRGPFAWFRVDDDDVLSTDFFDAVAPYVTDANVGMALSYGRLATCLYVNGQLCDFHTVYERNVALGMVFICRANVSLGLVETPPMVPHHIVDRYVPTISSSVDYHALWIRHPDQDTAVGGSTLGAKLANLQATLGKNGMIDDAAAFNTKFPTVAARRDDPTTPSVDVLVGAGQAKGVEGLFADFPADAPVLISYALDFAGTAHPHSTLSFVCSPDNDEAVRGYFPIDDRRGAYRRLYVDKFGHGQLVMCMKDVHAVTALKLLSDPGSTCPRSARLSIRPLVAPMEKDQS